MSLLLSIAAGIGILLVIIVAMAVPVFVAMLVIEFTDAEWLGIPVYLLGVAVTLGTLIGVSNYFNL